MSVAAPTQVHEFMVMDFVGGIDPAAQTSVMEALERHFAGCPGLQTCEVYRDKGGRWVKHLVWESQEALEGSAGLEDDPVVGGLFDCFLTETVAHAVCVRVEPESRMQLADAAPV